MHDQSAFNAAEYLGAESLNSQKITTESSAKSKLPLFYTTKSDNLVVHFFIF